MSVFEVQATFKMRVIFSQTGLQFFWSTVFCRLQTARDKQESGPSPGRRQTLVFVTQPQPVRAEGCAVLSGGETQTAQRCEQPQSCSHSTPGDRVAIPGR